MMTDSDTPCFNLARLYVARQVAFVLRVSQRSLGR